VQGNQTGKRVASDDRPERPAAEGVRKEHHAGMDVSPAPTPRIVSAALLPVYRDADGDVRLVFIRRSEGGLHGGHLAFPGGKRDPHDASLLQTALREAEEEIGLPADAVQVLAELPAVETRTSGFTIHPFLARIVRPPYWRPCEREVAEVLEVKLRELSASEAHHPAAAPELSALEVQRIPFYRVGRYQLWGATYRILHPLLPRLMVGEWAV
jgi:8-oxo-dGTP pyrophosphatase MutT (NUDIX family)